MSDQNLNIHIKALDEFSQPLNKFKSTMEGVSRSVENVGKSLRSTGREIGQLGSAFTLLGASITAPLTLAYSASAKYSAGITRQINDMKDQYENLQLSIGEALLPVMERFNAILSALIDKWNTLSPAQQQNIVQTVYLTGVWALFGGIAIKVIGEIVKGVGDVIILFGKFIGVIGKVVAGFVQLLMVNPMLLAIYVVVGLIVAAMFKWKSVGDFVMNTMQKIADVISISFRANILIIEKLSIAFAEMIENILNLGSKIPGIGDRFDAAKYSVMKWRMELQQAANKDLVKIKDITKDLFSSGGNGSWANAFNNVKVSIGGALDGLSNFKDGLSEALKMIQGINVGGSGGGKRKSVQGDIFAGFAKGVEDARHSLADFFSLGVKAAQQWTQSMTTTFSGFFNDVFTGQLKKAQDYFVSFGNSILKIFSDVIAQMVTKWIVSGIVNMFSGLGGMGGGLSFGSVASSGTSLSSQVSAFGGGLASFAVGTDYVPNDMIAQIHKGEKIIPAGQNNSGGVNITIAPVITMWDASDVQRNKKMLVSAVSEEILRNGSIRQIIKDYGR